MPLLHMETEEARSVASLLQQYTAMMDEHSRQLHGSRSRLESGWQSNAATVFLGELGQALSRAGALSREGDALARRLSAEIAEWEAADASLGGSGTTGFRIGQIPIYEILPWPPGSLGISFRPDPGFPGGFPGGGGGGGGGGAWGADDVWLGTPIDSEYHLIRGVQYEYLSRYRSGEMTWDEMVKNLEEMEDSTQSKYIDKKLTLLNLGEREGSWSKSWKSKTITGQHGQFEAAIGQVAADGTASARISKDGVVIDAGGTVGAYAVHGKATGQVAGVDLAAQAHLGAQAKGELGATIDPMSGNMSAKGGGELSVGLKAEAAADKKDFVVDGMDVGVSGAAMAGAGVVLKGEAGIKDGVIKADYDVGAALGVGGQIGFSVELDVREAGSDIVDSGKSAIKFIKKNL